MAFSAAIWVSSGQERLFRGDARNPLNIVILDACRDNPFARSFRSSARGLARMDAPSGSHRKIDLRWVYTQHLLKAIPIPGLGIEKTFKRVRRAVIEETASAQVPPESSSLTRDFEFGPIRTGASGSRPRTSTPLSVEVAFWNGIVTSDNPRYFESYLERYGERGLFSYLARLRLAELRCPGTPAEGAGDAPVLGRSLCDWRRDGSAGPEMVALEGGCFEMGSPPREADRDDERHIVSVSRPLRSASTR